MNTMPASSVHLYLCRSLSQPIINLFPHLLPLFAMLIFCLYLRFLDQSWLSNGIIVQLLSSTIYQLM